MSYQGQQAYRQVSINTASRGAILVALFDGLLRYIALAKTAINNRDFAEKARYINASLAILEELLATLDEPKYPELCANLKKMYIYLIDKLQHSSLRMTTKPLDEAIPHVKKFRETWAQAVQISGL